MWVIVVQEQILGMVCINNEQSPDWRDIPWQYPGPVLVVHRLSVDPAFQGTKLASQLMEFAEEKAVSGKFGSIRLDAFAKNPAAIALYEGRGYRRAGTVPFRKGFFHGYEKNIHSSVDLGIS